MKYKCVIFDLDGTLVDTLEDIAYSMNRALEEHGFPPAPLGEYPKMVGWGIKKLAYLALPSAVREGGAGEAAAEAVAADASRFYAERPLGCSKPYPGIPELLAELRGKKIKTAVLTNKPDRTARLVIGGLFLPGSFDAVYGERPGIPRKPDPASAWDLLLELDSTPRETVFIGDSEIDIETARAAQCHALGVSWGFRSREILEKAGADRIIDLPRELLELFS
ncbi:MAG: HAD family hydrolase [Treponema sp.]|jgi:phosphoglycolate phosphatase|nr:HAD family hydrolase [Treponema sp.]